MTIRAKLDIAHRAPRFETEEESQLRTKKHVGDRDIQTNRKQYPIIIISMGVTRKLQDGQIKFKGGGIEFV